MVGVLPLKLPRVAGTVFSVNQMGRAGVATKTAGTGVRVIG